MHNGTGLRTKAIRKIKKLYSYLPAELRNLQHQLSLEQKPFIKLIEYYKERKEYKNDPKRNSPPNEFKYYLCVCAIVRNEADYIAEWLEFHLYAGVEKFYIYDNESDDNTKEILKPYVYRGIVEYYYLPGKKLELHKYTRQKEQLREQIRWCHTIQYRAYADAVHRAKYAAFWLAFIDIDEFIVPVSAKTIPEFLHDFENQAGIELYWLTYGYGSHINKSEQLVIERFQHHSLFQYPDNSQKKLIVNPRFVFLQRVHNTWFFEGKKSVNSDCCIAGHDGHSSRHDKIRLNHYHSKSFEEWLLRRKGDPAGLNNPLFIEEFGKMQVERNTVKDDMIMQKYIEPVKEALKLTASHSFSICSHVKISVIVPVYNAEKYLHRCLSSIVMQTFADFECILVDDASTDNSPAICDEYSINDKRVTVIHNEKNTGSSQTRKTGLGMAKGDYVLFIDSDDWIENTMLEKLYKKAENDNLDFVFCNFFSDNHPERITFISSDKNVIINQIINIAFLHNVWNKLIKREIYEKIEFPQAGWAEDRVITVQTVYYAQKIGHIEDLLYHHCTNEESMTYNKNMKFKRITEDYENWKIVISFLESKYGKEIIQFEPALSRYTNKNIKLPFLKYKEIRDKNKLFEVYPHSNTQIFTKYTKMGFLQKIFFLPLQRGLFFSINYLT
jgi:glycosyltransferase involved in cell wall biosynthesis